MRRQRQPGRPGKRPLAGADEDTEPPPATAAAIFRELQQQSAEALYRPGPHAGILGSVVLERRWARPLVRAHTGTRLLPTVCKGEWPRIRRARGVAWEVSLIYLPRRCTGLGRTRGFWEV